MGNRDKRVVICNVLNEVHPDILVLQETKIETMNVLMVKKYRVRP